MNRGFVAGSLALLLCMGGASRVRGAGVDWVDISPPGDALSALVAGPGARPIVIVAHPTRGLYRSTNGGEDWTPAGEDLKNPWGSTWVTALELSADGSRAAAGTRGSGLFISDDGGRLWHPAGIGFDLSVEVITRIRFDPRDADHLLLGTNAGLFQSVDAGQSVKRVRIPTGGRVPGEVIALDFHPGDSLRAYASLEPGGLFATSDGGATWLPAGNGLRDAPGVLGFRHDPDATVALAAGPSGLSRWRADLRRWAPIGYGLPRPSPVCALVALPGATGIWVAGTRDGRVFASDDEGESWRRLAAPEQPGPLSLAVIEPGVLLLAGGAGLFRSGDGGRSWVALDRDLPAFRPRLVVTDPAKPGAFLVAGGDGIRHTENYGGDWQRLGAGLPPEGFAMGDLAAHRSASGRLAAATDAGVVRSEDGGRTWWNTGLNRWTGSVAWLEPPATGLVAVGVDGETTRLWRSEDDGISWSEATRAPADRGAWVTATPLGLFLAGSVLQRSDGDGATWIPLPLPPDCSRLTALASVTPERLLGATDAGLFASADRGLTWTPAGFAGERILGLVRGGPDESTMLLLSPDALNVSRDLGVSWSRIALSPAMGGPLALALDASGRVALVAAEAGLYALALPGSAPARPRP